MKSFELACFKAVVGWSNSFCSVGYGFYMKQKFRRPFINCIKMSQKAAISRNGMDILLMYNKMSIPFREMAALFRVHAVY